MPESDPRANPLVDPVWSSMRADAVHWAAAEPALTGWLHGVVIDRTGFEDALVCLLSQKLAGPEMSALVLHQVLTEVISDDPSIGEASRADLSATYERDPACTSYLEPFIYFKGYRALQAYRFAHSLWARGRERLALFLQSRVSEVFHVDIHPAARIGRGIMIDHATGVVIGETAVIGDGVSLLHGVTLGGTGKERGDRHPKIGDGTMIGAGAAILGNIRVGRCSRVGAGSVVLNEVPDNTTVAGVPAREGGSVGPALPSLAMDQRFS